MKTTKRWERCGLGMLLALACDGEQPPKEVALGDVESELVDTWCGTMFECDCADGRVYSDASQCTQVAAGLADALAMYAGTMGLVYDPTCVGEFVAHIEDRGCKPPAGGSGECEPPCNPIHGSREVGQMCEGIGNGLGDCRQGLMCYGTCEDPCGVEGAALGELCQEVGCAEGLYCKWNDIEARCAKLPEAGDPCPDGSCADDAFCALPDPMATETLCIAPRELGEPCMGHLQCESRHCPAGYCTQLPGRGDSCPAQVCDTGLTCREGVCEVAAAEVCWLDVPWYLYGY